MSPRISALRIPLEITYKNPYGRGIIILKNFPRCIIAIVLWCGLNLFCSPLSALTFHISLTTEQAVPAPTLGGVNPSGEAWIEIDPVTRGVTISGTYRSMTSAIGAAQLHGLAVAGSTAGVLFGLSVDGGTEGGFQGGGVLSQGELDGLLAGETYISVHTANNGAGEIRGQVVYRLTRLPPIKLVPLVVDSIGSPVAITHAGDGSGRLFVATQRGKIHIIESGQLLPDPFLDISGKLVTPRVGTEERGLLGLAFDSHYSSAGARGEGKFYVYYSAPSPRAPGTPENPVNHMSVIAEFAASTENANVADLGSERILLTFDQPQFNHNAGAIAFGPDGMLYIATGDGGSGLDNDAGHTGGSGGRPSGALGNSQDRTNLHGNILRIDPAGNDGVGGQYGIPPDNPFVAVGGGVRPEIFAYGLRNPWGISFDDGAGGTGRLFCADVGQGKYEEINLIEGGKNYGWRRREGSFALDLTTPAPAATELPIAEYGHRW